MMKKFLIPVFLITLSVSFLLSCKKEKQGDGTVPEIIVLGYNPVGWALDTPYTDQGATAYDVTPLGDTVDLTNSIVVHNNVDVSVLGDYTVKYNVSDESGVSAIEKVRNVKVIMGK